MKFSRDDTKSSCEQNMNKKLAEVEEETLTTKILYCWKPKVIKIIVMKFE